MFTNGIVWR